MYVRVLGDDAPWKTMIYHVTWLRSGNKASITTVTTITTITTITDVNGFNLYHWHTKMLISEDGQDWQKCTVGKTSLLPSYPHQRGFSTISLSVFQCGSLTGLDGQ